MTSSNFTAEWGFSPKLENMSHDDFGLRGNIDKDLDVTDQKVLQYIGSIESALQDHGVEVDGTVQVYESEHTTERNFNDILRDESEDWTPEEVMGGGIPDKGEEYFGMLEASNEALHAIQAYDGQEVDEDFNMYDVDFESYDELVDEVSERDVHILGASVEYETDIGKVEFNFHSPSMHFEDFDFDNRRRRDRFERFRDQYPMGIDVYGDNELKNAVNQASPDFNNKWRDQVRNQVYDMLS